MDLDGLSSLNLHLVTPHHIRNECYTCKLSLLSVFAQV
jgi:hypothetical protein